MGAFLPRSPEEARSILDHLNVVQDVIRSEMGEVVKQFFEKDLELEGLEPLLVYHWYPVSMMWNCMDPDNELGRCVYDHHADPAHDSCLFCGEPEERK